MERIRRASRVRLTFTGTGRYNNTEFLHLDFAIDGVMVSSSGTLMAAGEPAFVGGTLALPINATYVTDVLTAGSHTFEVFVRTSNTGIELRNDLTFTVEEL